MKPLLKAACSAGLSVLVCFTFSGSSFAQQSKGPLVTIPNSEHHVLHSKYSAADYEIDIHLPDGYNAGKGNYPVLFVVDGANDFSPAQEYLGLVMAEYHIPEPIVIAIGDGGRIGTPTNRRMQDFTPTAVAGAPKSGGASKFLEFIDKELLPFVDSRYKTDKGNRTLYGYSLGGLFASYVLFHQPELFKNILIGSPALSYDNGRIFEDEKAFAAAHKDLPVHVFVEVGELEDAKNMVEPNKRLVQQLKDRHYPNLDIHSVILPKATHMTGKPDAMLRALAWAYTKPHVEL